MVSLGCHSLPESIGDMVGAEESRNHDEEVKWHQGEGDREPSSQDNAFIPHVRTLATWKDAPRVAGLRNRSQYERTEVSTTPELILDRQSTGSTEVLRPLAVDLSFQVESALLVGDVTGSDKEGEADP